MAGIPNGDFDERLVEALNSALLDGEELIVREMGDQGQAIALTRSRIIILKVGLAASGEMDGSKTASFEMEQITAINLRKGPLGAVIQVCAGDAQGSAQGGTPDNVIVFTGPGRVKKAEAFAASIESATGKTVTRVEHKFNREQKPLVVEVHDEVAKPEAVTKTPISNEKETPITASVAPEPEIEEIEEAEQDEYIPNPKLPKPIRKRATGPNKLLVVFGVLAGLTLVGMAVMAPLQEAQNATAISKNSTDTYGSTKLLRLQVSSVSAYRKEVFEMVAKADRDASTFRTAVASGNKSAILSASRSGVTDDVLQRMNSLSAPSGLADAKDNITNGILIRKNAITAAAAAAGSPQAVDVRGTLAKLDQAESYIKLGLSAISAASASLDKQVADLLRRSKKARTGIEPAKG